MTAPRKWTAAEDEIVLRHPIKEAAALCNRTEAATRVRRFNLQHPRQKAGTPARWSAADKATLREQYPIIESVEDLVSVFDGRFTSWQIRTQARYLGLKRKYLGNPKARVDGHWQIIDQIRIRAREDGLTMRALDRELQTGKYFQSASYQRHTIDLAAAAKAVLFFGGSFVIDWCDRAPAVPCRELVAA